jgi:hypothetical protein
MKLYTIAIGAGLGYLAGNEQARRKTAEVFHQMKSSPTAKAVEDRVSSKVSDLTSKTSKNDADIDVTDPSYIGGADAVDPNAFGKSAKQRPSMVSP